MIPRTEAIRTCSQIIITTSDILDTIITEFKENNISGVDAHGLILAEESRAVELIDNLYKLDMISDRCHYYSREWLVDVVTEAKSHLWG